MSFKWYLVTNLLYIVFSFLLRVWSHVGGVVLCKRSISIHTSNVVYHSVFFLNCLNDASKNGVMVYTFNVSISLLLTNGFFWARYNTSTWSLNVTFFPYFLFFEAVVSWISPPLKLCLPHIDFLPAIYFALYFLLLVYILW